MSEADDRSWVGGCHCGNLTIHLPHPPEGVTRCNCSVCTKTGFLGVYYQGDEVTIEGGPLVGYVRDDLGETFLSLWHCARCGVTTHWTPLTPPPHDRIGVNARLFGQDRFGKLPINECDGAAW